MLPLNSKNLTHQNLDHLASRQKIVNDLPDFESKAKRASALWDSKSASRFGEIRQVLKEMCVGMEICVYCENNEATDVEHIYPKKLYPEKTFRWENYVLACGKCNSHHKSDKFRIFVGKNSPAFQDITPPRGTYTQPANDDALFINQRNEDPMDFLELDLLNRTFVFVERSQEGSREYNRASFTKNLLGLNTRAALVMARKSAAVFFVSRLESYVKAKKSNTMQELKDAVNDDLGSINSAAAFNQEKQRIIDSIKADIESNAHPTVWRELIRQRANLPKTNGLLTDAPEATAWLS